MTQTPATDSANQVAHTVVQKQECQAWAQVPEAITDAKIPLGPRSYLTLLVKKMKYGSASNCWDEERFDGNKSIAEALNRSPRTIQRYRRYLAKNNWIICTPRFLPKGGQTSNLVKLNMPMLVSGRSAISRQNRCHPAHDKVVTPPVTEMSPKLNPPSPTKPPPCKTTGADGAEWSQLEKEVCERFRAVAPPRVKFKVEKFREMQAKAEMTSSKIQAKLAELAACPFLAAECRSIAIIYHLIDKNSNAYREARDSIARLRLAIRKAKTQDEVEVAMAEVAAKSGWQRNHIAHYIRTRLGFDIMPGAPKATKRSWVNVNQPPNPTTKPAEPTHWLDDITGDEGYTQSTASPALSSHWGDITGDKPVEEVGDGSPVAPAAEASDPTSSADQVERPATEPIEAPRDEGDEGDGNQPSAINTTSEQLEEENAAIKGVAPGAPKPTPPPASAAEVMDRIMALTNACSLKTMADITSYHPPTSEVVIRHLIAAERQELDQAA